MSYSKKRRFAAALLVAAMAMMASGCSTDAGLPLAAGSEGNGTGHAAVVTGGVAGSVAGSDDADGGVQLAVVDTGADEGVTGSNSSGNVSESEHEALTGSSNDDLQKQDGSDKSQGTQVTNEGKKTTNDDNSKGTDSSAKNNGGAGSGATVPEKPRVTLDPPTGAKATFFPKQGQKLVALTFDDGPDNRYTPDILAILKEEHVKATFFMVGTQVKKYPETVQQIVKEGHAIGNHTYHHANLAKLDDNDIKQEIKSTDELFQKTVGFIPNLVRAPYGSVSDIVKSVMKGNQRDLIGWTVDTRDWDGASVAAMRANVIKHTHPGGIVLMHSFGSKYLGNTVKVLPLIIKDLEEKGYTFVTVDELLAAKQMNKAAAAANKGKP